MTTRLRTLALLAAVAVVTPSTFAADAATPAVAAPATAPAVKLTPTVGIDIVKKVENPDNTLTLTFRWKDKAGEMVERSVIVNEDTVIGIGGKLSKMSDLDADAMRNKAVATVGADMVTAVSLRVGRAMLQVTADELTPKQRAQLEAAAPKATDASNAAVDARVAQMVGRLNLNDAAKEAAVTKVLVTDLRAVRDAHNAGFAPAKHVHKDLNEGLAANLTPDQIEQIKNAMTINKVPITFNAYHSIVPGLTEEDDKFILANLKLAREEALDVKNPDEMTPIFEKYKTINEKYITAHGHDWHEAFKAYTSSHPEGGRAATTRPATAPATN